MADILDMRDKGEIYGGEIPQEQTHICSECYEVYPEIVDESVDMSYSYD